MATLLDIQKFFSGATLQQQAQRVLTPSSCASTATICAGLHCSTSVSYNTMRLFLPSPKKYALLCADLCRVSILTLLVSNTEHLQDVVHGEAVGSVGTIAPHLVLPSMTNSFFRGNFSVAANSSMPCLSSSRYKPYQACTIQEEGPLQMTRHSLKYCMVIRST